MSYVQSDMDENCNYSVSSKSCYYYGNWGRHGPIAMCSCDMLPIRISSKLGQYRFLVSVLISGQYQRFLMLSESVKYVVQVPILLFVHIIDHELIFFKVVD